MWVSSVFLLSFPRPPPLTPLRRDRSASLVVIMSPFFARRRRRAARPWFWLRCLLAGRWMMLVDEQHFFTAAITSPLKKQNNIATHSPCHFPVEGHASGVMWFNDGILFYQGNKNDWDNKRERWWKTDLVRTLVLRDKDIWELLKKDVIIVIFATHHPVRNRTKVFDDISGKMRQQEHD